MIQTPLYLHPYVTSTISQCQEATAAFFDTSLCFLCFPSKNLQKETIVFWSRVFWFIEIPNCAIISVKKHLHYFSPLKELIHPDGIQVITKIAYVTLALLSLALLKLLHVNQRDTFIGREITKISNRCIEIFNEISTIFKYERIILVSTLSLFLGCDKSTLKITTTFISLMNLIASPFFFITLGITSILSRAFNQNGLFEPTLAFKIEYGLVDEAHYNEIISLFPDLLKNPYFVYQFLIHENPKFRLQSAPSAKQENLLDNIKTNKDFLQRLLRDPNTSSAVLNFIMDDFFSESTEKDIKMLLMNIFREKHIPLSRFNQSNFNKIFDFSAKHFSSDDTCLEYFYSSNTWKRGLNLYGCCKRPTSAISKRLFRAITNYSDSSPFELPKQHSEWLEHLEKHPSILIFLTRYTVSTFDEEKKQDIFDAYSKGISHVFDSFRGTGKEEKYKSSFISNLLASIKWKRIGEGSESSFLKQALQTTLDNNN